MRPVKVAPKDIMAYVQNKIDRVLTDAMEEGDSQNVFQLMGVMSGFTLGI